MRMRAGFLPQIHLKMIALFLLLAFLCSASSFTPPRILYGGWTPILPGHPFFFGRVSKHPEHLHYAGRPTYGHQASSHSSSLYNNQDHDEEEYRSYRYGNGKPRHTGSYDRPKDGISHIHTKSIFSYYPPRSAYDQSPRSAKIQTKPVYHEVPRNPLDVVGDPHKFVPYVLPSGRGLLPQDLKVLSHGGKEAYLKITPIGKVHPNSIKPIGHINLDSIQRFPSINNGHNYKPNHGSLRNYDAALYSSRPHASNYRDVSAFNPISHNHLHSSEPHSTRESMNNFKGTSFPHSDSDVIRNYKNAKQEHLLPNNINPGIKSYNDGSLVYYLDENDYKNKAFSSNPSILPSAQFYPLKTGLFSDSKYSSSHKTPYQPSGISKDLYSSSSLDKINQGKNNYGPKSKFYSGFKSQYTTPFLTPGSYNFNQYPKSIQSIIQSNQQPSPPENSYGSKVNKNYDYKNVGVGRFYHDPTTLSNLQDIPTIVDKEVEIVHIPANAPHQYSSTTGGEVLHIKGSTTPNKHSAEFRSSNRGNDTFSHYTYEPETYLDHPLEFHILEDDHGGDSEAAGSHRNAEEHESVFVGTRSLDSRDIPNVTNDSRENKLDNPVEKKQFFHAYYAPSDHSPPKGYLKMSTEEFDKLFKDAEIQYVQRGETDGIRSRHQVAEKRSS